VVEVIAPLPNIRRMIVPDPGMVFIELDLKQADAQVVAWESDDPLLKSLFRRGIDIYTETETGVWLDPALQTIPRQIRKNCVHSVDYGAGWFTLSEKYVGTKHAAEYFITTWFKRHPRIREWQRRVEFEMKASRTPTIHNIWGYRRVYATATPITQPLAWIGQSTVAITNHHIMLHIDREFPQVQLLEEDHDSLLMQVPERDFDALAPTLLTATRITIPYPDPLIIPAELKFSARSRGDMEEWKPCTQ
jgi:DNA polymerase I-like protein with 3'-5' exonuclease and polymerase domains